MELNQLSYDVIGCAIRVHKESGPGLLESAYHECLYYLLEEKGFYTEKEKPMPVIFAGVELDLLIENKLVAELKAVEKKHDVHWAQVLSYLKLGDFNTGLLINFNVKQLKKGIKRVVN